MVQEQSCDITNRQTGVGAEKHTAFSSKSAGINTFAYSSMGSINVNLIISEVLQSNCNFSLHISFHITKTQLYNFDSLKPYFYKVKLEFTGVPGIHYFFFFYFCSKTKIVSIY